MNERTIQYGVLKLKAGARVMVPNGKKQQSVEVGDKTRHPGAKFVCRCITCKEDFADEAALLKGHPPIKEMIESESVHVWAFFSESPTEEREEAPKGATPEQRKEIDDRNAALPRVGLVSDEAWG